MRARQNKSFSLLVSFAVATLITLTVANSAYCQIAGIYALGPAPKDPIPAASLQNPNIDGIALRYGWDDLEPRNGVYNWSKLDQDIQQARSANKKVSISVTAGFRSPRWVYASGVATFSFPWQKPWGPPPCSRQSIPIPWDPNYLSKWKAFVAELGRRYAGNPTLSCIKLTGVNGETQETLLPHSRGEAGAQGISCTGTDNISEWVSAGYTRAKVNSAWMEISDTFASSFPTQTLALMIGPRPFPPIDDTGNIMPRRGADMRLSQEMVSEGMRAYGSRFAVQNNGLSAVKVWNDFSPLGRPSIIGYQMAWEVTNDPGCRMNGGMSPCDPQTVLRAAFERGIEAGAKYFEIYESDAANPALAQVIEAAHRQLARQDH